MKKFINLIIVITIISFGLIGSKALFHSGFYTSHDGEHQLIRQYVFEQGLKDRQIPVRYNRQLYNGHGYPLFFFTYRLPFYFGEIFRIIGLSFADSIKSVFFITYIASGLAMFWFARRWGNIAGLIAAILYMWAPYRFSVIFVRAALGEHVSAVFVPLLFASVSGGKNKNVNFVLGAVSLAGLFLSHAMMTQIALLAFIPWLLMSLRASTSDGRSVAISLRSIPKIFFMFILGIGLSAYYLLPAAVYRGLTQKLNPNYFTDHFVTLRQLIYSPWGYAFSMKGVENDGMSFQIGIAQWLAVFIVIPALSWNLYRYLYRFRVKRFDRHELTAERLGMTWIKPGTAWEALSLLLTFFLSIFLMTEPSAFIWNRWKNYINIDMPWRFLLMTAFSASALVGIVIKSLALRSRARLLLAIVLVALAFYTNRNHLRVNEYFNYPDARLKTYAGTSNSDNEYRPKWDDGGIVNSILPEASVFQGRGELKIVKSKSNLLELAVKAEENIRLDINILYFPGWNIFVDGKESKFKYAGEKGIMRIDLEKGYHMVEAKFSEPPLGAAGDFITIISFIILISLIKKNYAKT
ncbi:hypothetical protein HZB78_05380 [Candidatus Collierbacteria bacterium]|nr:hypothetical protein [Candidatus Collierbacteria bacterium]